MTAALTLRGLSVRRQARRVLQDVTAEAPPGSFIGLIGANGAGKTTLLRAALGLLPATGESSLLALSRKARAREVAFIPQEREIAWGLSVREVVGLGRRMTHHAPSAADDPEMAALLADLGLSELAARPATALSGGEAARVLIARALWQDTALLLADEPISGLDPARQIEVMQLFARLARGGKTIIAALHDLSLVARYCSHLWLMDTGQLVAKGGAVEVLSAENLGLHFGLDAKLVEDEQGMRVAIRDSLHKTRRHIGSTGGRV